MTNHNKLLLSTIAAVGIIGLAGSSLAARYMAPTHMGDAQAHGESHADANAERQDRSSQGDLGEIFFEETFQNMDALEVQMGDADVILQEGRGDQITVTFYVDGRGDDAWAEDMFERAEFRAEASGSSLLVESSDPHMERSDWSDHGGFNATVVIQIPSELNLSVQTSDGDIMAERIAGRANISSADGDVLIDVAEGDALNASTADGDIVIERLSTTDASISTADGDILLNDVRTALDVSTGDGDLSITFSEAHEANISTGDGDVMLFVPATLRATFRLVGEDLNIAAGMELQGKLRDNVIEGSLNGGGPQIDVRTGDGSVTLRQHN